jgi:hypothetical protein
VRLVELPPDAVLPIGASATVKVALR